MSFLVEGPKENDPPLMNTLQISINYWIVFVTKKSGVIHEKRVVLNVILSLIVYFRHFKSAYNVVKN